MAITSRSPGIGRETAATLSIPLQRAGQLRAVVALHQNGSCLNGSFASNGKDTMTTWRALVALRANRKQFLRLAAVAVAFSILFVCGQDASSQASKTIKFIIPVPPGGAVDFLARLLAEQIGRSQGLTIVIESRPGAGGRIATEAVARLAPDGTTLLMTYPSLVIDPHVRKVNYEPLTSFGPICNLVEAP